jgi:hypothetical protein
MESEGLGSERGGRAESGSGTSTDHMADGAGQQAGNIGDLIDGLSKAARLAPQAVNWDRVKEAFPSFVTAVEAIGYVYPTNEEVARGETPNRQEAAVSRLRDETRPPTVPTELDRAVPATPNSQRRIVRAAQRYLDVRYKPENTTPLSEAISELRQAAFDEGELRWLVSLGGSHGRQEDSEHEAAEDGGLQDVRVQAPSGEVPEPQEVADHLWAAHNPLVHGECFYPEACHYLQKDCDLPPSQHPE